MIRRSVLITLFAFSTLIVSAASTKPCDPIPCPECGDPAYTTISTSAAASTKPCDPIPCPECGDPSTARV
ncbi:MAG: hypothetical protein ABIZ80_22290 [Bryobacteraceae bacterium]